jgi:hypothetical protein
MSLTDTIEEQISYGSVCLKQNLYRVSHFKYERHCCNFLYHFEGIVITFRRVTLSWLRFHPSLLPVNYFVLHNLIFIFVVFILILLHVISFLHHIYFIFLYPFLLPTPLQWFPGKFLPPYFYVLSFSCSFRVKNLCYYISFYFYPFHFCSCSSLHILVLPLLLHFFPRFTPAPLSPTVCQLYLYLPSPTCLHGVVLN